MPRYEVALLADVLEVASLASEPLSSDSGVSPPLQGRSHCSPPLQGRKLSPHNLQGYLLTPSHRTVASNRLSQQDLTYHSQEALLTLKEDLTSILNPIQIHHITEEDVNLSVPSQTEDRNSSSLHLKSPNQDVNPSLGRIKPNREHLNPSFCGIKTPQSTQENANHNKDKNFLFSSYPPTSTLNLVQKPFQNKATVEEDRDIVYTNKENKHSNLNTEEIVNYSTKSKDNLSEQNTPSYKDFLHRARKHKGSVKELKVIFNTSQESDNTSKEKESLLENKSTIFIYNKESPDSHLGNKSPSCIPKNSHHLNNSHYKDHTFVTFKGDTPSEKSKNSFNFDRSHTYCSQKGNPFCHLEEPTSQLNTPLNSLEHVELALMGNGQCCFRRYPGYQSHRHVVVSRGVQCNEMLLKKNADILTPRTTEKGDSSNIFSQENMKNNDTTSFQKEKADFKSTLKLDFLKNKPEIYTLVTEEPPELRESSKFYQKKLHGDVQKSKKYFDDDIDSLSATISNYSLHDRMLKFDNFNFIPEKNCEKAVKNTQQPTNVFSRTPTPRQRQMSFKGSTDAIRGSTTKTLTCQTNDNKIVNKNEFLENQSSDSFTSFGHYKENKNRFVSNSDNTESTVVENEKVKENEQSNINNQSFYLFPHKNMETFQNFLSRSSQYTKPKNLSLEKANKVESHQEEKPIKNHSDSKCSSSVTFMKGSEELQNEEKAKSLEFNNLNALRRKQKFLMRHTRNNSKFSTGNNSDCPPVMASPEFPSHFSAIKGDSTPISVKPEASIEYQEVPFDTVSQKHIPRNSHFTLSNNEPSRNNCASRNSNHSERATITQNTNMVKLKRTVSFDKNKVTNNISKAFNHPKIPKVENTNQTCTRNLVKEKYCSNKIIRQRFYIPESANIELILKDPSDRRIKAICDRHNCDIEIYSKVPKSGFLKNIIVLAAPNSESLRKCVRSLDYSMCWCLTAQLP